ncbi:MAG: hypothetical protein GX236_12570 [Clostridiaceae bacterium]|jgi:hypothetical protein|nr:hypothetical protein [Clostridiaceae bacterium]
MKRVRFVLIIIVLIVICVPVYLNIYVKNNSIRENPVIEIEENIAWFRYGNNKIKVDEIGSLKIDYLKMYSDINNEAFIVYSIYPMNGYQSYSTNITLLQYDKKKNLLSKKDILDDLIINNYYEDGLTIELKNEITVNDEIILAKEQFETSGLNYGKTFEELINDKIETPTPSSLQSEDTDNDGFPEIIVEYVLKNQSSNLYLSNLFIVLDYWNGEFRIVDANLIDIREKGFSYSNLLDGYQ